MKLQLLPSITVLPPPHDHGTDHEIIDEWARGLEWVKWLLGSVRARTAVLLVEAGTGAFIRAWEHFSLGLFRDAVGPALKSAWGAAQAGDLAGLLAADAALSLQLTDAQAGRSCQAGAVLLKSTRNARYQGVLGRLRETIVQGESPGHIAVVWAATGHFFQLSLTNVIAEYLRLEWDIAVRDKLAAAQPATGQLSIAGLTSHVLAQAALGNGLRILDA
jgi:hypothetical protein